jgi:hypothetical protein
MVLKAIDPPVCPKCGQSMMFTMVKKPDQPGRKQYAFFCPECRSWKTIDAEG